MKPARKALVWGNLNRTCLLIFLACLFCTRALTGLPQKLGDLDEDGVPTVLDLVRLINCRTAKRNSSCARSRTRAI
jgi:hypothetical protein